jgi:cell wall-associated NlpC family hydrolase
VNAAEERARVVAIARSWIGTPFHHNARIKGVGVDCAQLLAAVFAEAALEDATLPEYSADWFLHEDRERYLDEMDRYTVAVAEGAPVELGDIPMFRYGRSVSHAGIIVEVSPTTYPIMVHSFRGIGVTLDELTPTGAMTSRLAGVRRLNRWAT